MSNESHSHPLIISSSPCESKTLHYEVAYKLFTRPFVISVHPFSSLLQSVCFIIMKLLYLAIFSSIFKD
jgi:hypothetical protein